MSEVQIAAIVSKIASFLSSEKTYQEKLQAVYDYLVENGYRYTLETITLQQIIAQISKLEALKIRSFAALVLEEEMCTNDLEDAGKSIKRNLIGPAKILNYALSCTGLRTQILYDKIEKRHVLVAFFKEAK